MNGMIQCRLNRTKLDDEANDRRRDGVLLYKPTFYVIVIYDLGSSLNLDVSRCSLCGIIFLVPGSIGH
jgi:hypothetical protein